MKILQKIEKGKSIWFIFFSIFAFLLLRLPSLIEPLWYGDEGIYQVVGMALNKGRILYSQIWDNKPPLLYFIYALAHSDQFTVRLFSLIFGAVSIIAFYYLTKKLFRTNKISAFTTTVYIILIATPIVEGNIANAENFMLLPILLAALLIFQSSEIRHTTHSRLSSYYILNTRNIILSCAGFLLGLAFLLKTVAIFDFTSFFFFLSFITLPEKFSINKNRNIYKEFAIKFLFYFSGFLTPIIVTVVYFLVHGALADFIYAIFFGNIVYVGYENNFFIPQGLLFIKLIILFWTLLLIFHKRKNLSREVIFIYLWFLFSLFNLDFSGRPWTHYLLVIVPSASLMFGLLIDRKAKSLKLHTSGLLLIMLFFAVFLFNINLYSIIKTISYYKNFALFTTNNESLTTYQEFFDINVPRNYEIAQFIKSKTSPNDTVFIWGNNPQIYALANKIPPGKYTVEYHISQNPKALAETIETLKITKPKYIIVLPETPNMPFTLENYINKFSLNNSEIYEINL
jgi:hypothetical protein